MCSHDTVHATVEDAVNESVTFQESLNTRLAPVATVSRPFDEHTSAKGDSMFSNGFKGFPQLPEQFEVPLDFRTRNITANGDVELLDRGSTNTRKRSPQRVRGASDSLSGFTDAVGRRKVIFDGYIDHLVIRVIITGLIQLVVRLAARLN